MPTPQQADAFHTEGYFIAEDAVDPNMFDDLAAAARRAKAKVRAGQVDVYTHWSTPEKTEPWAIRGLLAPEFDEPVFAEYLMSKPILDYVHYFIGTELRLGAILIFINPHHADYDIGWHRDWGGIDDRDLDYDGEMAVLHKPRQGWRWHLATVDDECLQIMPGSHRRYRTAHERTCLLQTRQSDIPGQRTIKLKAGQTAFWSGDTIHRGVYKKNAERLTISAAWSVHEEGGEPQAVDERLRWRLREDVRANLPEDMHPYYDRWHALQLDPDDAS